MSFYSTPLQFGYFFALMMSLIFFVRGIREERLSDRLLSGLMVILALELQDYTFGFSGINFLWNELNGFPRSVSLLFGPTIYFYLRSQINASFSLNKKHLWHLFPWLASFLFYFSFFIRGSAAVNDFQASRLHELSLYIGWIILIFSYIYYFFRSLKLYQNYRKWSKDHFSDIETVSFKWFRNFLLLMVIWISLKEFFNLISFFADLDFYQDWWWNLVLVAVVIYVGLAGVMQKQQTQISYDPAEPEPKTPDEPGAQLVLLADNVKQIMASEKLYLQPELTLSELSRHMGVNLHQLSASINSVIGLNYNDYINSLRVAEFEEKAVSNEFAHYTLLGIAYECGFNSKATFYRSFKKIRGISPAEFMRSLKKKD